MAEGSTRFLKSAFADAKRTTPPRSTTNTAGVGTSHDSSPLKSREWSVETDLNLLHHFGKLYDNSIFACHTITYVAEHRESERLLLNV